MNQENLIKVLEAFDQSDRRAIAAAINIWTRMSGIHAKPLEVDDSTWIFDTHKVFRELGAIIFSDSFSRYEESSDEVKSLIRGMVSIINCDYADRDEKDAAIVTLNEALYPYQN